MQHTACSTHSTQQAASRQTSQVRTKSTREQLGERCRSTQTAVRTTRLFVP
jgi:hypothetical protein